MSATLPLPHSLTLQTIVSLAVSGADADAGWVVVPAGDDDLAVVVAGGTGEVPVARGDRFPTDQTYSGFVLETGQPAALELRQGDDRGRAELSLLGSDSGQLLAVPCTFDDGCLGALEIVAAADRGRFDLEDVELATLLGTIAGAAIAETIGGDAPPSPQALGAELQRLADADPVRFATVARLVEAVLGP